jgi:hypothetical protein
VEGAPLHRRLYALSGVIQVAQVETSFGGIELSHVHKLNTKELCASAVGEGCRFIGELVNQDTSSPFTSGTSDLERSGEMADCCSHVQLADVALIDGYISCSEVRELESLSQSDDVACNAADGDLLVLLWYAS